MDDDQSSPPPNGTRPDEREPFVPARFPVDLGLPPADRQLLDDAAKAVGQEYLDCSKWRRLNCRNVSIVSEQARGTIYVVHIGRSVEFDWTWEGAVAFRPAALDDQPLLGEILATAYDDDVLWSGEVVAVDEQNGCLFLSVPDAAHSPTTGPFLVRPFEFLAGLNAIYRAPRFAGLQGELPARLAAAAGGIHPEVDLACPTGLANLRPWWQYAWSILWGPPGTGKTYSIGQQVAAVLADRHERILVVSTTNRATDAAALSIGQAAKVACPSELARGHLLRIGAGATYQDFLDRDLNVMLQVMEEETLSSIGGLVRQLALFDSWDDKALARKQIADLRVGASGGSRLAFLDPEVRVVVATAFKSLSYLGDELIAGMIENHQAPFTTVMIDEAGLISRAAVAALSLLASQRVVLIGDPKQLAPISRVSRILPRRQETWLASSGISHLDRSDELPPAIHVLSEQRRMHPDVCRLVSEYQYRGILRTAEETAQRRSTLPPLLANHSRAIWYVLDAEDCDLASIRAIRGLGNRGWIRPVTSLILEKLFSDPEIVAADGRFISPFRAQAQAISQLFATCDAPSWEASTVHSQQGSEADVVVFDPVFAGSCSWPFEEWKRLINVALSRAREAIIVLASRDEMEEPYLSPLRRYLVPSVLRRDAGRLRWELTSEPPARERHSPAQPAPSIKPAPAESGGLGEQLARRKQLRPVLSHEQQRLCRLELDGKPRLIRGVAGSGKSLVLSNWVAKVARKTQDQRDFRIWAVYANRSLHRLLRQSIEAAWNEAHSGLLFGAEEFPWHMVSLLHIKDVLTGILPEAGLTFDSYDFDYDRAAEEFLHRRDALELLPRCQAMFIDEAQDLGPATLRLLLSIVERTDENDERSRPVHIFYDNAQNIYGRRTPRWSEFGLDLRGRSSIIKESFRSTNPITELAVNLLHRLSPDSLRHDQAELMALNLIERTERAGREWLSVRYSQAFGPKPVFRKFTTAEQEMQAIASHLKHLITHEGVPPEDICLIYNGPRAVELLQTRLAPKMAEIGVELSIQTSQSFQRHKNLLLVTTAQSFKGYEAEVVLIPCVDQYVTADDQILANSLYVAMTRARSVLVLYALDSVIPAAQRLVAAIESCVADLNATPQSVSDLGSDEVFQEP